MSRVRQRQPSTDSFRLEELDDRQRTGAITLANREAEEEASGRPGLEANVILIAHLGWSALKNLLVGSTAERVVRHATCPVMVIRVKT